MCLVRERAEGLAPAPARVLGFVQVPFRCVSAEGERSKNRSRKFLRIIGWMLISFLPGRNRRPAPRFNAELSLLAAIQWPSSSYGQCKRTWFQWDVAATLFLGVFQRHLDS